MFSREVLAMIEKGDSNWEQMLPEGVADIIKEKELFNYRTEKHSV
ncbi:MAG: hypothetical protein ACJAYD_000711 [Patiriisocius sp.]